MIRVCKKHPRYQAKRKPRVACASCWYIWLILVGGHITEAYEGTRR